MKKRRIKKLFGGIMVITLSLIMSLPSFAQAVTITGSVTDQSGQPLAGTYVRVQGTQTGTVTDGNGNYSLSVNSGAVLEFSFVGYLNVIVPVESQRVINVVLEESSAMLQEVVVTGYMTQRKVDLTGSISVVKVNDLKDLPSGNALQTLQGKIPGMYITSDGSPSGGTRQILIRGISTLGSTSPLYVIDGVPTTSASSFQNIDPNSIESIQVLKDASAASIYGSRASNGVVIITTRTGSESVSVRFNSSLTSQWHHRRLDMANTEQLGRLLWQGSINDGSDPSIHSALYSYESHEEGGVPILDKVIPVEWIGGDPSYGLRSADTDWQDES